MQSYSVIFTPKNMDPVSIEVEADGQFEAVAAATPLFSAPPDTPFTIEVVDA